MEDEINKFLSGLALFSKLPKKEVSFVAGEIEVKKYPKSTILAVQGRTKLDCVYIIKEGRMELFYESHGEKDIKGVFYMFRYSSYLCQNRHKVVIPFPARDHMKMQVIRVTCSGNCTKVKPNIKAIRIFMLS